MNIIDEGTVFEWKSPGYPPGDISVQQLLVSVPLARCPGIVKSFPPLKGLNSRHQRPNIALLPPLQIKRISSTYLFDESAGRLW
jgi:hypothetical protein